MSLIYLFLISPRYYKPINSVKYNPILLLLLLSLCKNNNNCNNTCFSSSKVKNATPTADKNYKAYNKKKDNTINNYNYNTTYNNGCDSNTKAYINRKINHKKSTFKLTNKLTTIPEDINKNNLIDYNNTLFKAYDSSNTSNDIINETTDIKHNINALNSDNIFGANITDPKSYENRKSTNAKSHLRSTDPYTDINIDNLAYYSDEFFKSFYLLYSNNDIVDGNISNTKDANHNIEETINNHKDINHSIDHSNSDCIHNSDIVDTKDSLNKESNKKSTLKSPNKLTTTSENINTSDLVDYNDKSFDSLNTSHSNTENIEDNNINNTTDDFVSNCQYSSTNKSTLNKITSTIKHINNSTNINSCYSSNKANYDNFNISEDINRTFKLPTLLIKCDISDSFKGDINFCNYIASINDIKNKLVITSNLLLLDVNKRDAGTLFLDGYLETDIDYSIPLELKVPLICKHSNFVLRIPLNISVPIDLQYTVPGEENTFSDLDLSLVKSSFNIKNDLFEDLLLEDYISVYKGCELTLIANYYIEVFKNEVFHY